MSQKEIMATTQMTVQVKRDPHPPAPLSGNGGPVENLVHPAGNMSQNKGTSSGTTEQIFKKVGTMSNVNSTNSLVARDRRVDFSANSIDCWRNMAWKK